MPDDNDTPPLSNDVLPGARRFAEGRAGARVLLAAEPRRLHVVFDGDVEGAHLIGALSQARAAGLPAGDDFSALIDMTGFTGVLDWQAVAQVRDVMPKGGSTTNKNAYVVNNEITAALAKVNAALFAQTEHKAFLTMGEALAWLGWK
jgi:hypothetical protein